jgi:CRISPR system Cascade subunit CasD
MDNDSDEAGAIGGSMSVLLLRLSGPMQSWGIQSQFPDRDTGMEPSKSGVVGLLCAALGRSRAAPVNDLAELRMAVRVDWQGVLLYDYQTAMNVREAKGKGVRGSISKRFYLSDACFLVGLESDDQSLLTELHRRLCDPVWPLYLGRKAFVPGEPVWLDNGWRPISPHTWG